MNRQEPWWELRNVRIDDGAVVAEFSTPEADFTAEIPQTVCEVLLGAMNRAVANGRTGEVARISSAMRNLVSGVVNLAERQHVLLSAEESLEALRAEVAENETKGGSR